MADVQSGLQTLISEEEVARRVEALADKVAPRVDERTVVVCLLTGGLWFAADLTRALGRRGWLGVFDALWLASYGDEAASQGHVVMRAGLQRTVEGRRVLIVDDVLDSGLTLAEAVKHVRAAGASEVLTAVFARKPWPEARPIEADFVAWEAPARYLVGYGLDAGGRMRAFPGVAALD
jgi:hypoxanthine phosphoribosyltransferase